MERGGEVARVEKEWQKRGGRDLAKWVVLRSGACRRGLERVAVVVVAVVVVEMRRGLSPGNQEKKEE